MQNVNILIKSPLSPGTSPQNRVIGESFYVDIANYFLIKVIVVLCAIYNLLFVT